MLYLDRSQLIGKGHHRECFIHPEDESKCVKVVVYGDEKEGTRERAYYNLLSKKQVSWSMLSKFYGVVETNLGEGSVFELIRDYTGEISKTLEYYLETPSGIEFPITQILQSLDSLRQYLFQEKIVTMTIKPKNIMYQRISDTEGRLVIVDNIGHSDFLPVCDRFDWFAEKKIQRKWSKFETSLISCSYS